MTQMLLQDDNTAVCRISGKAGSTAKLWSCSSITDSWEVN